MRPKAISQIAIFTTLLVLGGPEARADLYGVSEGTGTGRRLVGTAAGTGTGGSTEAAQRSLAASTTRDTSRWARLRRALEAAEKALVPLAAGSEGLGDEVWRETDAFEVIRFESEQAFAQARAHARNFKAAMAHARRELEDLVYETAPTAPDAALLRASRLVRYTSWYGSLADYGTGWSLDYDTPRLGDEVDHALLHGSGWEAPSFPPVARLPEEDAPASRELERALLRARAGIDRELETAMTAQSRFGELVALFNAAGPGVRVQLEDDVRRRGAATALEMALGYCRARARASQTRLLVWALEDRGLDLDGIRDDLARWDLNATGVEAIVFERDGWVFRGLPAGRGRDLAAEFSTRHVWTPAPGAS